MSALVGFFVLGVLTWTFLEYVMHRFLGHDKRFSFTPFAKEHIRHHVEGDYFAPTWKKAIVAVVFTATLLVPAARLLGPGRGIAYVGGLMLFYGVYEALHRIEHVTAGIGPYGRWARRHHFGHHFVDGRMNHGVTSPLWDLVFGTYRRVDTIKVPPQLCLPWLKDPVTGGIRAEHAATYVMRAGRAAGRGESVRRT
ncbi:MAG: sterol desaturase family protein [Polyangiaceae bacterium]